MPPTLTNTARRALDRAQREGHDDGDGYVASEHVLLALLQEPGSQAAALMRRHGVDMDDLTRRLHDIAQPRESPDTVAGPLPLTTAVQEALSLALKSCMASEEMVGTKRLLESLLEKGADALREPLRSSGADLDALRRQLALAPSDKED